MNESNPLAAWRSNPFFVLEVPVDAAPSDVERAGQKLLALMAIGSAGVEHYMTPLGAGKRDPDKVRQALAALRDPNERVLHEMWANIDVSEQQTRKPESARKRQWRSAGDDRWKA
jgi:hypothetical protein